MSSSVMYPTRREIAVGRRNARRVKRFGVLGTSLLALSVVMALPSVSMVAYSAVSGNTYMNVVSDSMKPELSQGDLLVVKPLSEVDASSEISVGDIIIYEADWLQGASVSHRVISMTASGVITQGDNNRRADSPVEFSKVRGRVEASFPAVGGVIASRITTVGFFAASALGAVFLMVPRLIGGVRKRRDSR